VANAMQDAQLFNMEAKMVVIACLVLHNFIREHNSEDLDFAWFYHYPHFVSIILERV
jgi:hypothetical protein